MKRFFTLLLIAMTGQSALWATSFATATTTFQHDLTEKELSDTIKTDPKNQPIELKEITIQAARVVQKPNGQLIFPSKKQCEKSANGYNLLAKLALPHLRVDEAMHTISALNNKGEVQIRLNGIIISKNELISLDPKMVKSIEFIDNPSVRYGNEVGYVLNIRTLKAERGGSVGIDLSNSLTAINGTNTFYAKLNSNKSEFSLSYSSNYQDFKGDRTKEKATYLLNNNTLYQMERNDLSSRNRAFNNDLQLKYTLADSASYVFQATLSTGFNHQLNADKTYHTITPEATFLSEIRNNERSFAPTLDLYYYHRLGKTSNLTANLVGTSIETKGDNYFNEATPYIYKVDGRMRSLYSELIYEQKLRPFTVSLGLKGSLKHIKNQYLGNVESLNKMDYSTLYMFTEAKGMWKNLGYTAGLGVTNARYKQAIDKYNYWLFRPKFTLNYRISQALTLRYSFEIFEHISRMAMISNTKIRENSREWRIGNPNVEPNKVVEHTFGLTYVQPRYTNTFDAFLRINSNPNMSKYIRTSDDQFYYMQANQKRITMWSVSDYINFKIIPDVLEIGLNGAIYRFINEGDDYKHSLTTFNFITNLQAYLGRFTLSAYADNGWEFNEGETKSHSGSAIYVGGSYQVGNLQLSLYWQNPFITNPKNLHAQILNRFVSKDIVQRGNDFGNLLNFNLSWKLEFGKQKSHTKKRKEHKDTDTGIMKRN